ncbi:ComC/BlpC family peptide pheromone/bacteriocin [Streptococcus merionis]|uniref:ComC/BlpC family peptide pheromone/bacteriocin n=1 Tax=Streptococcus merionis TaxID=400065 RepID=UPI0035196CAC
MKFDNDNIVEISSVVLENIEGGSPNLGSAIGACAGGVLMASLGGPITFGAGAVICVASGFAHYVGG